MPSLLGNKLRVGGKRFIESAFNPLTIPSLAAWYDTSQAAGVSTQTGGIHLLDLSGNALHLISASSAKRPQLTAAGQNGRDVATFDGVDDMISAAWVRAQPVTIFVALKVRANSAGGSVVVGLGPWSGADIELWLSVGNRAATGISAGTGLTPIDLSSGTFASVCGVFNGVSSVLGKNGVEITGNAGANSATAISLGDSPDETSVNSAITVGELIVVGAACDVSIRTQVNSYLRSKWGI